MENHLRFTEFAGTYFNLWRDDIILGNRNNIFFGIFKTMKKKVCVKDLSEYSALQLKESLLMLPKYMQEDAKMIEKSIRKTILKTESTDLSIKETKYIRRLYEIALSKHIALRDEIYSQLIRITNNNPSPRQAVFIFQLMICCLAVFPPSKLLYPYMKSHLQICSVDKSSPRRYRFFAETCLLKLESIIKLGARRYMPNIIEINHLIRLEVSPIKIKFMDGKSIVYNELDSWSRLIDVKRGVSRKIGIMDDYIFAIIFQDNLENMEIHLPENYSVMGFLFEFYSTNTWPLNSNQEAFTVDIIYKVKLYVSPQRSIGWIKDSKAINLYYSQVLLEFIYGKVVCESKKELVDLAGLIMFIDHGRCPVDKTEAVTILMKNSRNIVPLDRVQEFECVECWDIEDRKEMNEQDQLVLESCETKNVPYKLTNKNIPLFTSSDEDEIHRNCSGTWMLKAASSSSDTGRRLCSKIRKAWSSIDMTITSKSLGELTFIQRIFSFPLFGVKKFPVWVSQESPSMQRWILQIINPNRKLFLNEINQINETGQTNNNKASSSSRQSLNEKSKLKNFESYSLNSEALNSLEDVDENHKINHLRLVLCIRDDKIVLLLNLNDNLSFLKFALENTIQEASDPTGLETLTSNLLTAEQEEEDISKITPSTAVSPIFYKNEFSKTECSFTITYNSLVSWGYSTDRVVFKYKINSNTPGTYHIDTDEFMTTRGITISDLIKLYYNFPCRTG